MIGGEGAPMRRLLSCVVTLAFAGLAVSAQQIPPANAIRPYDRTAITEQAAGWKPLFDGKTTNGWRGFKKAGFPATGWSVDAGRLKHAASGNQPSADSGDIITIDAFNDFDLRFEWVVASGANSGIKYLVTEERDGPIAHEYQIIDDAKHPDALIGPHRATAALYDVIAAPTTKILKPALQKNEGRIVVQGNHVEHWLNGAKVIEYELGSAALKAAKAKSKFKDVAGWGEKIKGHILLQDHGDEVWYQNIRIKDLGGPSTRSRR
jgi:hypothetical protein